VACVRGTVLRLTPSCSALTRSSIRFPIANQEPLAWYVYPQATSGAYTIALFFLVRAC